MENREDEEVPLACDDKQGTYTGYHKHRKIKQKPCLECRQAYTEYSREYRKKNREVFLKAQKAFYYRNQEKKIEEHRKWRAANPEKALEAVRNWVKNNPDKYQENNRKQHYARRQLLALADFESFSDYEIFERDGWVCQLCLLPVDKELPRTHSMGATIDHVLPVSRGGGHTRANTQLAHRRCNSSKRDRDTISTMPPAQYLQDQTDDGVA